MPGKKINRNQIGLYMKHRKEGKSQIVAAYHLTFFCDTFVIKYMIQ